MCDDTPIGRPSSRSASSSSSSDDSSSSSSSSTSSEIDELKERIDELKEEVNDLNRKADQCRAAADRLEEAKKELEEAIIELERAIEEAIKELEEFIEEVKETDRRHANMLRQQLQELHNFNNHLKEIRESFDRPDTLMSSGISWIEEKFKVSIKPIIDKLEVRRILELPHDKITPEQYAHLAQFFVSMETVVEQNWFLNALAQPIEINPAPRLNQYGVEPYTVCADKVLGIKRQIDGSLARSLEAQRWLYAGGMKTNDPVYKFLEAGSKTLMERSAMLSVVHDLAVIISEQSWITEDNPVYHILAGDKVGPFKLEASFDSKGVQDGVILSVRHGTASSNSIDVFDVLGETGFTGTNDIRVSLAFRGSEVNREIGSLTEAQFLLKHEFDMLSHLGSEVSSHFRDSFISGAADLAMMAEIFVGQATQTAQKAGSLVSGLYTVGDIAYNTYDASKKAKEFQEDVRTIVEKGRLGQYYEKFDLYSILISEEGKDWQALSWPSSGTQFSVEALNSLYEENYTMRQFLENPTAGFDVFRNLTTHERGEFERYIKNAEREFHENVFTQSPNTQTTPTPPLPQPDHLTQGQTPW